MSVRIALTGRPGIGKTTAIKKIVKKLKDKVVGFWTEEIRNGNKREGFEIVRTDGKRELLASVNIKTPYRVGKYKVNVDGFEKFVVPFLKKALKSDKILVIDEIGKMELFSKEFEKLIQTILNSKKSFVVTIPIRDIHPVVKKLKNSSDVIVLILTEENRNEIPDKVMKLLEEKNGR